MREAVRPTSAPLEAVQGVVSLQPPRQLTGVMEETLHQPELRAPLVARGQVPRALPTVILAGVAVLGVLRVLLLQGSLAVLVLLEAGAEEAVVR